jgi:hypothetical protein
MNCISSFESKELILPEGNLLLNFKFWHKTVTTPHCRGSKLISLDITAVHSYVMSINTKKHLLPGATPTRCS